MARVRDVIASGDGLHVELIVVERRDRDRASARDDDRHLVVEVVRRRQDHLVARIGHREDGVHEREVAAGRHHHAARSADPYAVFPRELVLDGPDERGQPFDRTVPMVRQRIAKSPRRLDRFRGRPVRHDTLPQRDRAGRLGYPAADDGDDRCLDRGETGGLRVEGSARHGISINRKWRGQVMNVTPHQDAGRTSWGPRPSSSAPARLAVGATAWSSACRTRGLQRRLSVRPSSAA